MENNIAYYCKKRGMTQRELAKKIGATEVSVSRWIKCNRIPKVNDALKIAKALGTSVYELFEEDDE